jgi:hypothetical protein
MDQWLGRVQGALEWTGGLDEFKEVLGWIGGLDESKEHWGGPMAWLNPGNTKVDWLD